MIALYIWWETPPFPSLRQIRYSVSVLDVEFRDGLMHSRRTGRKVLDCPLKKVWRGNPTGTTCQISQVIWIGPLSAPELSDVDVTSTGVFKIALQDVDGIAVPWRIDNDDQNRSLAGRHVSSRPAWASRSEVPLNSCAKDGEINTLDPAPVTRLHAYQNVAETIDIPARLIYAPVGHCGNMTRQCGLRLPLA